MQGLTINFQIFNTGTIKEIDGNAVNSSKSCKIINQVNITWADHIVSTDWSKGRCDRCYIEHRADAVVEQVKRDINAVFVEDQVAR